MHNTNGSVIDLFNLLGSAQPLTKHEEILMSPSYGPAHFKITAPAKAKGSAAVTTFARLVAVDWKLPAQFEGVKARFIDQTQGVVLQPVVSYNDRDADCYPVVWSKDGKQMSIDLSLALINKKWATPPAWMRRAPVSLHRNLPNGAGSFLYLDLKNSELRPRTVKAKRSAAQAEAAAAKQG